MNDRSTRLAWALAAATALAVAAAAWLAAAGRADTWIAVVVLAFVVATAATGVVLASRLPGHTVGWLLQASALAYALGSVAVAYLEVATTGGGLPVSPVVVWGR